jgi:hypothetical protein
LKVDVEGSERAVFEGGRRMIQNGIDIIHFEFNEHALLGNFTVSKAMDLLPGYSLHRILPNRLMPLSKWSPSTEVYRYQNIIAMPSRIEKSPAERAGRSEDRLGCCTDRAAPSLPYLVRP